MIDQELGFEQWEIDLFARLIGNPAISVEAVLVCRGASRLAKPGFALQSVLAIEAIIFGMAAGRVSRRTSDVLEPVPHIPWNEADRLHPDLDLILSHVPGLPGAIRAELSSEVWEYSFNRGAQTMPEALGFRETKEQKPVTRMAIFGHLPCGTYREIGSCEIGTKFSAVFTAMFAKSILPAFAERELVHYRKDRLTPVAVTSPAAQDDARTASPPSLIELGTYVVQLAGRVLRRTSAEVLRRFGARPGSWSLLIGRGDALNSPLDQLTELRQPDGQFRADPFLFQKDGQTYVFFESCDYSDGRGKICVGRIDGNRLVDITEIDLGDGHLSYPFVFAEDGEIFMIPETSHNRRVEVWRCTEFPARWTLHATGLEGHSPADTVLFKSSDQWWLLTNLCTGSVIEHCMELHAYRVDGPDLELIEPHPLNPVVLDTTSARNAGRPFERDGRLIRPAQMNSHGTYGYGLRLMEVTELSMDAFSEREIRRIEPDASQATIGCHHLDINDDMFILDARRAFGSRRWGARPIALRAS